MLIKVLKNNNFATTPNGWGSISIISEGNCFYLLYLTKDKNIPLYKYKYLLFDKNKTIKEIVYEALDPKELCALGGHFSFMGRKENNNEEII